MNSSASVINVESISKPQQKRQISPNKSDDQFSINTSTRRISPPPPASLSSSLSSSSSSSLSTNSDLSRTNSNESSIEQTNNKQQSPTFKKSHTNKSDDQINIYINNVVCSYSTRCHLNLRRIAMEGLHVEYKKETNVSSINLDYF
jgi:hypothetical protein